MKTWKDAFQFFPIWGSRNIKEDFCLKTYSIIYLAVFFEEKEKKMGFVISENQLKHLGFPEKKKMEFLIFQWGRKLFDECHQITQWRGASTLQMCRGQHQILRNKSPFMILWWYHNYYYDIPFCLSIWRRLWQHLDSAHIENTGTQWKNLSYSPQLSVPPKRHKARGDVKCSCWDP